jgi:molybdopterin-guanine dinucleotide biosynthesis protein B
MNAGKRTTMADAKKVRLRAMQTIQKTDADEARGHGRWLVPGHPSGIFHTTPERAEKLVASGHAIELGPDLRKKRKPVADDTPDTDTCAHRRAGADEVMLIAPDQMVLLASAKQLSLTTLAHRYFSDADIVIGEGFKEARQIAKIEVVTNPEQQLRREVRGVIAVATDLDISADYVFRLNEAAEIAEFIQKRFIDNERKRPDKTALLVNGRKIVLKRFIQESLAGVVAGYVESLKTNEEIKEIELRIKL